MALTQTPSGRLYGVNRPCQGESVSGDGLFYHEYDKGIIISICDGLGHGRQAHEVSSEIITFLEHHHHQDIEQLILEVSEKISPSIGAAMAMAYIDFESNTLWFCGMGNVGGFVIGANDKIFVSKDGMVGANMHNPLLQSLMLSPGDKFVMASDGIHERFYSKAARTIFKSRPVAIVEYLLSDFSKPYDDASCWVFEY
ncbi:MAG: SpoIIE family protein phosphatase [Bermanella sp.]